jgi:hypothetical protein
MINLNDIIGFFLFLLLLFFFFFLNWPSVSVSVSVFFFFFCDYSKFFSFFLLFLNSLIDGIHESELRLFILLSLDGKLHDLN